MTDNKLNKQYFETKEKRKKYVRKKLTFKRGMVNVLIFILMIFVYSVLNKQCSEKIKENELNDIENNPF